MAAAAPTAPRRPSRARSSASKGGPFCTPIGGPVCVPIDTFKPWGRSLLSLMTGNTRKCRQSPEPAETQAAQDDANGGDWPPEPAGYGRAGEALAAQRLDLRLSRCGEARRAVVRPGGPVAQSGHALRGKAVAPLAHRLGRDPGRHGDLANRPALGETLDHQQSTTRCGSGILMAVHPGLRVAGRWPRNRSQPTQPRRDNLHSNDI